MYLDGEDIDAATVFAKLRKNNELRRAGGAPYLHQCMEEAPVSAGVSYYADIIKDQWKLRKAQDLGRRMLAITSDADEVPAALEDIRTFLDDVDEEQEATSMSFHDLFVNWTEHQDDDRPSLETPWPHLNQKLNGGLQRQRLYLIGARPGCGKTIMGAQIGLYCALMHQNTLVFSLELSKEDLMGRVLACGAHVPYRELTSRKMSPDTMQKISQWVGASAGMSFEVDDTPDYTIEEIAQACRIHKQRKGLDCVFIDYAQYLQMSKGDNREQQVAHIAQAARNIARKLDCVVVMAAQLNRNLEDPRGKPRLPVKSDFRESGGLEQTADVAWVLSRPADENGEESKIPMMNLTVVKNRTGTEGTLRLIERFDQARFDPGFYAVGA